jgi:hypothetical protein
MLRKSAACFETNPHRWQMASRENTASCLLLQRANLTVASASARLFPKTIKLHKRFPFLTSVGRATNPRIKSDAIRVPRSPERKIQSGRSETLSCSKWETNHSENFRYARIEPRETSSRLFGGVIIYRGNSRGDFSTRGGDERSDRRIYATHARQD